jgi:cell wall-associated NlpC family hydrolase
MNRDKYIAFIRSCVGLPYQWGGNGNPGYDCSGIVVAGLNSAGAYISDATAQNLYDKYKDYIVPRLQAAPGTLFFYGVSIKEITHVMSVVEHWNGAGIVLIGARGGDAGITTPEKAAAAKSFVDAVWGDYWLDKFVGAVDPFAESDSGEETIIRGAA